MPKIILKINDDIKFVLLLSCFLGHPVVSFHIFSFFEFDNLFFDVLQAREPSFPSVTKVNQHNVEF